MLEAYGLRTTLLEHPALISYPLESRLEVISAEGQTLHHYTCLGHAFSASMDGLEAEVVDVNSGTAADYAAKDVRGKVALINSLATPTAVYDAEQAGTIGQIFVNDDHLHNMIVTTVWGTPTPQSAERMPKTPAVSIIASDGGDLRARMAAGSIRVRIHTQVFKGWQITPIVIGEIDGRTEEFVMLSGHQDSWHYGAMDNGSANATMLEVARLCALHRDEMYRGLRVIFWSGHSHGRYSGSTWYADNHWEELYDRCVAHVNVDSTGARSATYYSTFLAHRELGDFGARIITDHTGQQTHSRRMSRAGDMSFNGVGIPALFMSLSQVPVMAESDIESSLRRLVGGTMPWWWHTSEDTIDKIDPDVLELDTKIYLSAVWHLCHDLLLPMDFRPVVADFQQELRDLQQAASTHFDLHPVMERAVKLAACVEQLALHCAQANDAHDIESLNRQMKSLSRILIPGTYTSTDRFDHDPAWPIPHLPGLQGVRQLAQLQEGCDDYHFLKTQQMRNRNAVMFALGEALTALRNFV
ncbi:MAG: M28 family peptidase [Chloroflexota bacterium]